MILVQIIVSLRCAPCFQKQGRKNDWLDPLRGPTDHNHIHHKKTENLPANTTTEENTPQNGRPGQSGMMKGSTPPMWHGSGKPPGGGGRFFGWFGESQPGPENNHFPAGKLALPQAATPAPEGRSAHVAATPRCWRGAPRRTGTSWWPSCWRPAVWWPSPWTPCTTPGCGPVAACPCLPVAGVLIVLGCCPHSWARWFQRLGISAWILSPVSSIAWRGGSRGWKNAADLLGGGLLCS